MIPLMLGLQMGIESAVSGLALAVFFLLCLWAYYIWENDRRDKLYGPASDVNEADLLRDEISKKTDREITSFRYVC